MHLDVCHTLSVSQPCLYGIPISYEGDGGEACAILVQRSMVSITSTYGGVINFLSILNSYTQRIAITDLTIELRDMINDQLHCRMTITIYLIKDTEQKNE